ncbi:MBL fold metallo-hydrolase [Alphaproteobacteria bacterium]|nr:MBL fold metallo-hydrolase [Alphaproteobacteria bacterium]
MDITFFGVRGSTPVSGKEFAEFGGSTTSLEIITPHCQIIFDTGSGFCNIKLREDVPVFIIYSHFHHDHIQGLAFNPNLFTRRQNIYVCSALTDNSRLKDILRSYFSGSYFPFDAITALNHLQFIDFARLGDMLPMGHLIESIPLNHPGGASGYRLAAGASTLCFFQDHEYEFTEQAALRDFSSHADLVVWDGMFTEAELTNKKGWGHSSIEQGIQFASDVMCKKLAIAHHAPSRTDKDLRALQTEYENEIVFFARETMTLSI